MTKLHIKKSEKESFNFSRRYLKNVFVAFCKIDKYQGCIIALLFYPVQAKKCLLLVLSYTLGQKELEFWVMSMDGFS